ncbi:MAG: type II toxin-antitoxin system ParD family antitoxin [archaeon]
MLKYIAGYIIAMATLSADVTAQMQKWIDSKVKAGLYKSRSEVVRELLREKMEEANYPKMPLSAKTLKKVWDDNSDKIWESYL